MPPPPVEVDPQLAEIEEWEAAALAATIEAFERQQLEDMEEVEQQLRQEVATRKAATKKEAANARKD